MRCFFALLKIFNKIKMIVEPNFILENNSN